MARIKFSDTTPAAPAGSKNVRFQSDNSNPHNISANVEEMVGDSGSGGESGLVPAPAAGDAAAEKYLKADGTWDTPAGGGGGTVSPLTTKGDIYTYSTTNDRQPAGSDGQVVTYDSSQPTGLTALNPAVPCQATITSGLLSSGQCIGGFDFNFTVTFPGNFSGSVGKKLTGGSNPTATVTCLVKKNGSNIGTMVVSTSSVYTFTTTSGSPITFNAGDLLEVIAPSTPDSTWTGFTYTLWGNRGITTNNGVNNPAVAWKGAYNNATAYNSYEIVSYRGGVYISIQPTTGNAPTLDGNNSYWQFVMGDGWFDRGVYSGATAYVPNDIVRYIATGSGYSTYRCIASTTGNAPTNATYWVPVAQAGTDGNAFVLAQSGQATGYTLLDADKGKIISFSSGSSVAVTLPQAGASSQFLVGWYVLIENTGAGTVTVTPTTSTLAGATSLAIPQNQTALIFSDGTNYGVVSGGGGSSTGVFVDLEVPSGTINGSNTTFTLANTPNPSSSLQLFENGILLRGGGVDYTLSGSTITYVTAPSTGSTHVAFYRAINSGPTGGVFVDLETPSGSVNGSNTTFTLSQSPNPVNSLLLTVNGIIQKGSGVDFNLAGSTITFTTAPATGDVLLAWYRVASAGAGINAANLYGTEASLPGSGVAGQTYFATDSKRVYIWNGSAWILQVGGMILLEQHTASASATLDFTSWYSSFFDEYELHIVGLVTSTAADVGIQFSSNSGSSYDSSAIYDYGFGYAVSGTASQVFATGQTNLRFFNGSATLNSQSNINAKLTLVNVSSTSLYKQAYGLINTYWGTSPFIQIQHYMGVYKSTSAMNALRFIPSTGNFSSGVIRIYGMVK